MVVVRGTPLGIAYSGRPILGVTGLADGLTLMPTFGLQTDFELLDIDLLSGCTIRSKAISCRAICGICEICGICGICEI